MVKVTSKFQVTVPNAIAEQYRIRPGHQIDWVAAGDVIRVIPSRKRVAPEDKDSKLRWFDRATERHRRRPSTRGAGRLRYRGWTREDL